MGRPGRDSQLMQVNPVVCGCRVENKPELVCFAGSAMMDARNDRQQVGASAGLYYGLGEPETLT
jgi:hypothetical protein